jgi:hypothetical protein
MPMNIFLLDIGQKKLENGVVQHLDLDGIRKDISPIFLIFFTEQEHHKMIS